MTVAELIEALKKLPGDYEVVTASDPEGNAFNQACELSYGWYDTEGWDRDFSGWTYDLDTGYERPRKVDESNAICIWP